MTAREHPRILARSAAMLAAVVLLAVGSAQTATPSATAAGTVTNGMIATFAWPPGVVSSDDLDLVVMRADGSGAQILVPAAAARSSCGFDLDWSPDGNRIAWASGGEVWSVRADGTDRTKLADACVTHLAWSPDGSTLAVEIGFRTGLLTVAGGGFRWLRSCASGEEGATFSPDGATLATVATQDCDGDPIGWGIYGFGLADGTLDARYADTNLRGQPPNSMWDAIPDDPDWHPTLGKVLMTMDDGSEGGNCHPLGQTGQWTNSDLFTVVDSADSPLVKVGSTSGEFELSERAASWSPDGQRIVFTGDRNVSCQGSSYVRSGVELFTMAADGSAVTKVWTPWNAQLGFVRSSWQPCTATTSTCVPVPGPVDPPTPPGTPPPSPTPSPTATPTPGPGATAAAAPSRMAAPVVVVRGRKAVVRWRAARANGSAVTSYLVDIRKGKDKTAPAGARKVVFRGLKPGRHKFRVAATNGIGMSEWSTWARVRIRS